MVGPGESLETAQTRPSDDRSEEPREVKGRPSNPPQRRLSPADIDDLVAAYKAGANIRQLAANFGVHRTTVTAHLDRQRIRGHHTLTAWTDDTLREATELYATGLSLAAVATRFGIDAQTVANRLRRAGVPVRPRRGWHPRPHSEQDGSRA